MPQWAELHVLLADEQAPARLLHTATRDLGTWGDRDQDPLLAVEGPRGDSRRRGRPAVWFTSTVSVTPGRPGGSGQEKGPSKEPWSPVAALTSHVLHGAVKHEIEQRVEPLQDAAGL